MERGTGYSLWLMLHRDRETETLLEQVIRETAEVHRTSVFKPHVTLLADVPLSAEDMQAKTAILAHRLRPYQLQLGELGSNGIYFQMLFSVVDQTPVVMYARDLAESVFGLTPVTYFPHLSLAYGDLTPNQVEELRQRITDYQPPIPRLSFTADSVSLWSTIGTVEEWYEVATYPFPKP